MSSLMQQTEVYLKSLSAGREEGDKNSELQAPPYHWIKLHGELSWWRFVSYYDRTKR